MPTLSVSKFSSDSALLNTPLWHKQQEILEQFWKGNYTIAVWALGRRSGKTLMAAITAVYAAIKLADEYRKHLRPGERFYIVSVANTLDQARIALQNIKDLINGSPLLRSFIDRETADTLELTNGAVFRAMPASSRGGRGMACPLLIFDELAHSLDTSGNAAGANLYQALSPSVAQFGSLGKVMLLSSPWIQQGIFWDMFKQASSGRFDHMQVINLPTWEVNPTISREFLEQEKARDPELFAIEYGANFSQSLAAFISGELVDAAQSDRGPLPAQPKYKGRYYLSLDPAKGNRDQYTACIAHYEGERFIVDRWHRFAASWSDGKKAQVSIDEVENWILEQHKLYGFQSVVLDQYNSAATIQRLSGKVPISEQTWTAPSKTEAYSKLRELFNALNIDLYQHEANQQIKNLTVLYRTTGQWSVSGGNGAAVDDYAAALAGAVLVAKRSTGIQFSPRPTTSPRFLEIQQFRKLNGLSNFPAIHRVNF